MSESRDIFRHCLPPAYCEAVNRSRTRPSFTFQRAQANRVMVNLARTVPDCSDESVSKFDLWGALGWPHETSVAMGRLVFSRLFDRHPSPFDPDQGPGYIRATLEALNAIHLSPEARNPVLRANARRLLRLNRGVPSERI